MGLNMQINKHVLSSDKLSYFQTCTSLSLVMVSICSLRTGYGHWILSAHWHHRFRENQPFATKTRGLAAPLNGRCWQEIRCSIISSLRTLDVGIENLRLLQ